MSRQQRDRLGHPRDSRGMPLRKRGAFRWVMRDDDEGVVRDG